MTTPPRWDAFKRADPSAVAAFQVLEDVPRGQILASSRGACWRQSSCFADSSLARSWS